MGINRRSTFRISGHVGDSAVAYRPVLQTDSHEGHPGGIVLRTILKRSPVLLGTAALLAATVLTGPATAQGAPSYSKYTALGDSYAAGAGIPDVSAGACLRSNHDFGSVVAASLGVADYSDVTCAGAKVLDLTASQVSPVPQLDAVDSDTDLLTLGIGGNDLSDSPLGVVEVILKCILVSGSDPLGAPCHNQYADRHFDFGTASWVYENDTLAAAITATAPRLASALQAIHTKAPGAKIVLVGYPSVLPDNEWTCFGRQPLAIGDVAYLRGIITQLNGMLATTAAANGTTYVDTATPSKGHDVCSDQRWVEGLIPGSPALPFHPNAVGESAMAKAVLAVLSH
ncbi:SGNH/GDSL hydrolase family protein [Embleya scabrispora]|uniref:SGNH/GDSL hydrolase family protein n=1 Tax=Embleya scabrispora TaxID=159449 RepID=UPI00099F05C5|nr:SGNH/GDSL hydrolase family protein [Embleya scabrispora]MYS80759.1 SGNH/GDSL hydrolase family protein [Streptomyces sp. SID5474]